MDDGEVLVHPYGHGRKNSSAFGPGREETVQVGGREVDSWWSAGATMPADVFAGALRFPLLCSACE